MLHHSGSTCLGRALKHGVTQHRDLSRRVFVVVNGIQEAFLASIEPILAAQVAQMIATHLPPAPVYRPYFNQTEGLCKPLTVRQQKHTSSEPVYTKTGLGAL